MRDGRAPAGPLRCSPRATLPARSDPDLCVEILSLGTERIDRVRKLELYARFDVTYYWIIDLVARSIEEYVVAGDVYRVRSITAYDAPFRPAALPGFEFRLSVVGLPDGS